MLYIYNKSLNPYFNLALEEYFLTKSKDEFFIIWRNDNCIVVGKNQNTLSEINIDFVKKNDISVVRRLTGGGAVFHDKGNINFTFIKNINDVNISFQEFLEPIVEFLKSLGVEAKISGRNDIVVDEKKISGNAQTIKNGRMLHHGTLLFSANLKNVSEALKVSKEKYESKGVKSVESRVTNIKSYLKNDMTVEEFMDELYRYIKNNTDIKEYILTQEDIKNIDELVRNKYSTYEWNFGNSPKFNYKNSKKFNSGIVEVYLKIEKGKIDEIKIYGDFFNVADISDIENALKGCKYEIGDIKKALKEFDFNKYFIGISLDEFCQIFETID
nr:lipoate--protein ligase [Caloramator fervidus]